MWRLRKGDRVKLIQDQNGNILTINPDGSINTVSPPGAGTTLHDIRPDDWVAIPSDNVYHEIVKYELVSGDSIKVKEILVALTGMMGQFRVKINTGSAVYYPRRYVLSTQQNVFSETLGKEITVVFAAGAYISVEAKMLGIEQQGSVFAAVNCYK